MQICWKTPCLLLLLSKLVKSVLESMAEAKITGGGPLIPCKLTVWSASCHLRKCICCKKKNSPGSVFLNKLALWLAFWLNITICLSVCWIVWKSPNIWHKWGSFYSKESFSGFHQKYRRRVGLVEVGVLWKYRQNHWLLSSQLCSPGCTPFLRNLK